MDTVIDLFLDALLYSIFLVIVGAFFLFFGPILFKLGIMFFDWAFLIFHSYCNWVFSF
jgi:hypothetical protein